MRSRRDVNLQIVGQPLGLMANHGLVGVDARLGLGAAALGRHADPFQLALQGLLAVGLLLALLGQPVLLLVQPGRIIALPGDAPAPVQFQNPPRHVVQKIAIMSHGDDRAGEGGKIPFQPGHGIRVQVVGGLVEQQDVWILQQQTAQGHSAFFTARDHGDGGIARRATQGVHGHFQLGVDIPGALGIHKLLDLALPRNERVHLVRFHGLGEFLVDGVVFTDDLHDLPNALLHHFPDGARLVHQGLLFQVAYGESILDVGSRLRTRYPRPPVS